MVSLQDRDVVFVGYGIVSPDHDWDDYAGIDVRDKVVLVLPGEPGPTEAEPERFGGRALTVHGTPHAKKVAAAKRGAAAVLMVHGPQMGVPWEVYASHANKTKIQLVDPPTDRPVDVAGLIRPELVQRWVGDSKAWTRWQDEARSDGFTARVLEGARLSLQARYERSRIDSHNVIGVIEGRTRPDEVVIYTAHWDHVGIADEGEGDRIHNGAVDNATGTAALLALADAFSALPEPPDRSIVFIATTADEQGLLGAWHYVDHPVYPLDQTVGVINMDALFPFGAPATSWRRPRHSRTGSKATSFGACATPCGPPPVAVDRAGAGAFDARRRDSAACHIFVSRRAGSRPSCPSLSRSVVVTPRPRFLRPTPMPARPPGPRRPGTTPRARASRR